MLNLHRQALSKRINEFHHSNDNSIGDDNQIHVHLVTKTLDLRMVKRTMTVAVVTVAVGTQPTYCQHWSENKVTPPTGIHQNRQ